MKLETIRAQLESLLSESRYMASHKDADEIFKKDQEALEEVLDILHDYELQTEQIRKDCDHFHTETRPYIRNGVWLCPKCGKRVQYNHTHCHWCGKKMGWDGSQQKGGKGRCRR